MLTVALNVLTAVGNGKIMGGTIKNYSHNPYRRVEIMAFNERGPVLAAHVQYRQLKLD